MISQDEIEGWRERAEELRNGAEPKWPDEATPEQYEETANTVEKLYHGEGEQ